MLPNIKARQMPGGATRRENRRLEAEGQMKGPSGLFATEHLWLWLTNEANGAKDAKTTDGYYFHLS